MDTITNAVLVINLVSSLANVLAYGIAYFQLNKTKVDGKYTLTKRTLLFEFILVLLVTSLLAIVYSMVALDQSHVTQALYLLNFTLLLFNIGFNINAILLAVIVRG